MAHQHFRTIASSSCPSVTNAAGVDWPSRYYDQGCVIQSDGGFVPGVQEVNLVFISPYRGALGDIGTKVEPNIAMALDEVNASGFLPGYRVNVHLVDSACSAPVATRQAVRAMSTGPPKHGIIGDTCSSCCMPINDVAQYYHLLQLSPGCTSTVLSDNDRYPYLVRFAPATKWNVEPAIALVKAMQWRRVAVIAESRAITEGMADIVVARAADDSAEGKYPWVLLLTEIFTTTGEIPEIFDKIITYDARIIMVAVYENLGCVLMCEASQRGLHMPNRVFVMASGWWSLTYITDFIAFTADAMERNGKEACTEEQIFRSSFGYFGFDRSPMLDADQKHGLSGRKLSDIRKQYYKECRAFADGRGACHDSMSGYFYDGLWEWAWLLRGFLVEEGRSLDDIANESSREWLWQRALKADFQGVTGRVRHFNEVEPKTVPPSIGDRDGSIMVYQHVGLTERKIIALWAQAPGFAWMEPIQWNADGSKTLMCRSGDDSSAGSDGGFNMSGTSACRFPAGTWIPPDQVDVCPGGTIRLEMGCVACKVGSAAAAGATSCDVCEQGKFANVSGNSVCTDCPRGKFGKIFGASTCESCLEGSFNDLLGATRCSLCNRGFYNSVPGATACEQCVAVEKGGVVPTTKDPGSLLQSSCVCGEDQLRLADGTCMHCDTQAVVCPGFDDENVIFSRPSFSLKSVGEKGNGTAASSMTALQFMQMPNAFLCTSETDCPGDLAPDECPSGHTGIACAACMDGYSRSRFRDGCHKCDQSASWLPVAIFIVVLCLACVMIVRLTSRKQDPLSFMFAAGAAGGLYVNYFQLVGVLSQVQIAWPEPLGGTLTGMSVINFDSSLFQLECLARGDGSTFTDQAMKPLALIFALVLVCWSWAAGWYIPKKTLERLKLFVVQPDYRCLASSCILLVTVSFVPVAMGGFQIFNCYPHPSGQSSMSTDPAMICFEEEWSRLMLPAGIISIVVTMLSYALMLTVTWRVRTSRLISQRFDMLFNRFRPETFYWNCVILTRNILLSLTPSLSSNSYLVLSLSTLQLLTYFGMIACLKPWKFPLHNILDILMVFCVTEFSTLCVVFSKKPPYLFSSSEEQSASVWDFMKACAFLPVPCTLASVLLFMFAAKIQTRGDMHSEHFKSLMSALASVVRRVSPLADKLQEPTVAEALHANSRHLSVHDMRKVTSACVLVLTYLCGADGREVSQRRSSRRATEYDVVDINSLDGSREIDSLGNVMPPESTRIGQTRDSLTLEGRGVRVEERRDDVGVMEDPAECLEAMTLDAESIAEDISKPAESIFIGRTKVADGRSENDARQLTAESNWRRRLSADEGGQTEATEIIC